MLLAWQNMGIDPMMAMSQGQFGGFNGQGFGMNGMNMSINGGFDGNYPAWNMGMNGDFGANAGFYPPGGYNQQMQHGQANHMQRAQYHNNYNQNRFRGRGNRRGLGRDQQNHAGRSQSNAGMPYTNADPSADRKDTQQGDATAAGHHTESQRLDADPADVLIHPGRQGLLQKAAQEQSADSVTTPKPLEQEETRDQQVHLETVTAEKEGTARQPGKPHRADHLPAEPSTDGDHGRKSSTATMLAAGPSQRDDLLLGDRLGSSAGEAAFQDRMPCRSTDANAVSDVTKLPPLPAASGTKAPGVSGAPTGPKAMREGLPNVGLRGRHGSQANNISSRNGIKPSIPQTPASNVILRPSR